MIRGRVGDYRETVQSNLRLAFAEDHPPHLIAVSFALGIFITALPTGGTGLIVLAALGYRCKWANRLAFFAAIAVLNPLAKGAVYVLSFGLGTVVLGPVPDLANPELTLAAGREILVRLLVGNLLLAVVFAAAGYFIALYCVNVIRQYHS